MTPFRATKKGYEIARKLRKNMTEAERRLWYYLRGKQLNNVSFRRQHPIGNFVTDFCSIDKKMVIELDGSQHLDQETKDEQRSQYLRSQGYTVIRFWNDQVMNDINGVLQAIIYALENT